MYVQSYTSILTCVINPYYKIQTCWGPTNIKRSVQELVSYTVISTKVGIVLMRESRSPDIVDRGIAGQNIYTIIITINILL